jgi:hypothetical protein
MIPPVTGLGHHEGRVLAVVILSLAALTTLGLPLMIALVFWVVRT